MKSQYCMRVALQYINYDDGKHDLEIVQILVTMQYFAQIFGIFNVPR